MEELVSGLNKTSLPKLLGMKKARFTHWYESGFIPQGTKVQRGKRTMTLFTMHDLYAIALFKDLVDGGFKRPLAKRCIQHVKWDDVLRGNINYVLVTSKDKVADVMPIKTLQYLKAFGQLCDVVICVNLKAITKRVM